MSFRMFGFVTAGIVVVFGLFVLIGGAIWGHMTPDQACYAIGELTGMWLFPLMCLAVNKVRGKRAGGLTIGVTALSWLLFVVDAAGPFVRGFASSIPGL